MVRIGSVFAAGVAAMAAAALPPAESQPATSSSPATTSASAPAERLVSWHETFAPAADEAGQRDVPLLVVYFDPTTPACEAFEQMTLSQHSVRALLADFAACQLNVTQPTKQQLFAKTGSKETPLTQVLTPQGKLLDEIPGCIIPASVFCRRLGHSLEYWQAVNLRPFDPAARWRAVGARLAMSTRAEATKDIDVLLRLPKDKLPEGVSAARLHLAKGEALLGDPARARRAFARAIKSAPTEADIAGEALLALAGLDESAGDAKAAMERFSKYVKDFPDGAKVGAACVGKAVLQLHTMKDAAAAIETLENFVRDHPDDADAVRVRQLLDSFHRLSKPTVTTKPSGTAEPGSQPRPARQGKQGGQT